MVLVNIIAVNVTSYARELAFFLFQTVVSTSILEVKGVAIAYIQVAAQRFGHRWPLW
jgi:hypothetical protein